MAGYGTLHLANSEPNERPWGLTTFGTGSRSFSFCGGTGSSSTETSEASSRGFRGLGVTRYFVSNLIHGWDLKATSIFISDFKQPSFLSLLCLERVSRLNMKANVYNIC